MTVCRFYQSGSCKFGDNCKFEHPGATRSGNRFSAFGGNNNSLGGSLPYGLSKEVIEKDLTTEAPTWILSCYGPGRDAPEQLFGGYPREQSTEEIRLHYEKGVQAGKQQEALQEINQLYDNAKQQMQTAVSNLDKAVQFIADAANKRPNRLQIIESTNPPGRTPGEFAVGKRTIGGGSTAFGSGGGFGAASGSTFGQPSALGQKPNPFGSSSSAFGQPSGGSAFAKPAAPAFGSTSAPGSAFGSSGGSAFGQPSGGGSAFGQPSGGSAFGQTSTLGQKPSPFGAPSGPQTGGSAFGQTSQMGGSGSAFGQPSALGQKPSPFGAPSTGAGTGSGFSAFAGGSGGSPFGAASQPATSSPFGQPSQPSTSSPFGQPSKPAASSPFGSGIGQPASSSPFGAPQGTSTAPNPFAKNDTGMDTGMDAQPTSGFGGQSGSTPFGQPQQPQQPQQSGTNPFGQPKPSAFGGGAPAGNAANPYPPDADKKHPSLESYATVSMGRLSSWKGRPVSYKEDVPGYVGPSGKWSRIWFPNGPPGYYAETEEKGSEEEARRVWDGFDGRFDVMPEVPPLRVHCRWDF
ncbi:hypothetical protein VUR80DRAFT_8383 [Thermomyces stellatus]